MCPTAWSTKGVSQVILHMLLSGFFNTCSFCFCHPARHSDINLWLADSQAQVSAYSSQHIRTLGFPERIRPFSKLHDEDLSQVFFFCGCWSLVEGEFFFFFEHSFNCISGQNIASTDVLIRGQELKLLGIHTLFQFVFLSLTKWVPARGSTWVPDTLIHKTFYRNIRQLLDNLTGIEKWHNFVCAGVVSSPACLPFNTHSPFLVGLHNSWTWASMGPRFHLEPTVHCYSWTLQGKVKPCKRGLRSKEFKEGNVYEVSVLWYLTDWLQVHIRVQNQCIVCMMLWAVALTFYYPQNLITITSCLMYNSIIRYFKV